ncbi:MAG TPA: M48 family metallopeptidase [Candidatus Binatia bacterium]|jgi:predicted Zn-dependent protease|nr:M48 family metallopeptidase [Candidatus Binatia bacterium]
MRRGSARERGLARARLLMALAVAVFALFGYFFNTEINPVTGEKQRVAMSVEQERAIGLQAAPQMAAELGGIVDPRDPDAQLVAQVGRRLVTSGLAARSPYADNFNFHLLADPETVNAFALPGGQVFITRGLYRRLQDEAELAGVLGHEIGHVIHRHGAEHMAKGQLGQLLTVAVGVASDDGSGQGALARQAAMMANQMLQLRYGRADESESDGYGIVTLADAGYDPRAMLDVMKILKDASGGQHPPEMLSSHPLPETRLVEIDVAVRERWPDGVPSTLGRGRRLGG